MRTLLLTFILIGAAAIVPAQETRQPGHDESLFGKRLAYHKVDGVGPCIAAEVVGDRLYAIGQGNFYVLDITKPAEPRLLGQLSGLGTTRQLVVKGSIAYVTARQDGLWLVDVSDPAKPALNISGAKPVLAGNTPDTTLYAWTDGVCPLGEKLLIIKRGKYALLDPNERRNASELPAYGVDALRLVGRPVVGGDVLAFSSRHQREVWTLDIADIQHPRLKRHYSLTINRSLLLDRGDWVPYKKSAPVKFNVMDRDQRGVKALVIRRGGGPVEEIALDAPGVIERRFDICGDYTAHVVHRDGARSQACECAICDLDLRLPEDKVPLAGDWNVGFGSENINAIAVYLWNSADSYGHHPIFLTPEQSKAGSLTIPAGLLKKAGSLQVWLIGEHKLGRLKLRKDISLVK